MNNIIYLDQPTAASMTTAKELIKLYTKKDPKKYSEAIEKNTARYRGYMDELLGRNEEVSQETEAA